MQRPSTEQTHTTTGRAGPLLLEPPTGDEWDRIGANHNETTLLSEHCSTVDGQPRTAASRSARRRSGQVSSIGSRSAPVASRSSRSAIPGLRASAGPCR
jgi:hypothetical protein